MEYAEQSSQIVLVAKLGTAFEKKEGRYEFERRKNIRYKNETKFQGTLRVRNLHDNEKFPFFLENELAQIDWQEQVDGAEFLLRQSILKVRIPLKFSEFRDSSKGNSILTMSQTITPSRSQKFKLQRFKNPTSPHEYSHFSMHPDFYVNLLLTFCGDPTKVTRTEWERFEDKSVVSGGRPESNKRKF